jgi:hypothetical protein
VIQAFKTALDNVNRAYAEDLGGLGNDFPVVSSELPSDFSQLPKHEQVVALVKSQKKKAEEYAGILIEFNKSKDVTKVDARPFLLRSSQLRMFTKGRQRSHQGCAKRDEHYHNEVGSSLEEARRQFRRK